VRMGIPDWNIVISSNIPLRRDGLPYAGQAAPSDPGVAVYFVRNKKQMVLACDKFKNVEDNLQAICKTIEALRGIERWGASEMMERSFTGFEALPPPTAAAPKRAWWEVLNVPRGSHPDRIKEAYRAQAQVHHPDRGGDPARMAEVNAAYEEATRG